MRSIFIRGKVRPISFLPLLFILIGIILICISLQAIINVSVDSRLDYLENRTTEVENAPYNVLNSDVVQTTQDGIKQPENACYFINDSEREIIERVVSAESKGESYEGKMAVAQTILDRCVAWDMTPVEVVTADSQYADMNNGGISEDTKNAVREVFDYGYRVFDDYTTHFYSGVEPYWASSKESRGIIGNHRFMY